MSHWLFWYVLSLSTIFHLSIGSTPFSRYCTRLNVEFPAGRYNYLHMRMGWDEGWGWAIQSTLEQEIGKRVWYRMIEGVSHAWDKKLRQVRCSTPREDIYRDVCLEIWRAFRESWEIDSIIPYQACSKYDVRRNPDSSSMQPNCVSSISLTICENLTEEHSFVAKLLYDRTIFWY